ncbi:tetratricopeptide repeat protein 12-like isoform X1 [Porites lutea]|uniref:tetratricopeptide repeat protein 12-like isoform X1 n=1 Tax=Porites lutea TaxID=51062 RepID=UPI003CC69BCE
MEETTGKEEELQKFLGKVDEIDSIMKDLTCGDLERQNKALTAADEFLKRHKAENGEDSEEECRKVKTKSDRTVISKSKEKRRLDPSTALNQMRDAGEVCAEQFMKAVEEDAKERAKIRKRNESEAEKLKAKGNEAFKEGKFTEAISNYTMAINKFSSNPVLYTNRAQAYIKLEDFDSAIEDCNLALKIDEKWVKAFVHKARALQAQGKFDEAVTVLKSAIQVAPKQEKVLKAYIAEAESLKQRVQDEKEAVDVAGQGNGDLIRDSINRLQKASLVTSQCSEATRRLVRVLDNNANKTLFRCYGGFQITEFNKIFRKYWEGTDVCIMLEDIDFVCDVVRILMQACTDNDYNVEEFLKKDHSSCFNRLLRDPTSTVIRTAVTSFLHQLSQTEKGRLGLTKCRDIKWVTEALFLLVQRGTNTAVVAMSTINNLALEQGFCERIRDLVDKDFLSISHKFVLKLCEGSSKASHEPTDNWSLVSSGLSALANMARDTYIRNKIAEEQQWWQTSVKFLDSHIRGIKDQKVRCSVFSLLALLANISTQPNQYQKDVATKLIPSLIEMLNTGYDEICDRSLATLRHLLAHSTEALNSACDQKIHIHVIRILKLVILSSHFQVGWGASTRETVKKYSIKILALCTMERKDARDGIMSEKSLDFLVQLLHHEDEVIIGNTALCLSHCVDMKEVSDHLAGVNGVVEILLKHATNEKLSNEVKQNAAICLAKLATADERHLEKLREMHGLEVLHSVIQETNLR